MRIKKCLIEKKRFKIPQAVVGFFSQLSIDFKMKLKSNNPLAQFKCATVE